MRMMPLASHPAQEGAGRLPVGRAGVLVADINGKKFNEAPRGPFPCPVNQRRQLFVLNILHPVLFQKPYFERHEFWWGHDPSRAALCIRF